MFGVCRTGPALALASVGLALRLEAANFMRPAAALCHLAGPHLGGLVVGHVHQGEPAEELLGLDVGPVGDDHRATGGVGAEDRTVLLLQPPGEDVHAGSLHLGHHRLREGPAPPEPLLGVVAHPLLVEVDEVLGHGRSFSCGGPGGRAFTHPTNRDTWIAQILPDGTTEDDLAARAPRAPGGLPEAHDASHGRSIPPLPATRLSA